MWLIQSPTTIWQIQKSHYDVANSKSHYDVANSMSHYNVANSKPTSTWQIQSPLQCDTIYKACCYTASLKAQYDLTPLKARCYMAPFTKPVATWQYFTKSQNHFHKTQIIIWQLFFLKPR